MDNSGIMTADAWRAAGRNGMKRQYVSPLTAVLPVAADAALLAASGGGWTTGTKSDGKDIIEEDKDNPYDDGSFGAKGNFDWE